MASCYILRKHIYFPCPKRRMCYLIMSGRGIREERLPWRKTTYCRCHELKCYAICFQFRMKPSYSLPSPISLKNDVPNTIMSVSFSIISIILCAYNNHVLHCIIWMQHQSRSELLVVAWLRADIQTRERLAHDSPIHFRVASTSSKSDGQSTSKQGSKS